MTETEITQYLQEKDHERYTHDKDVQKTLRWAILSVLAAFLMFVGCVTVISCYYMKYVVPEQEEIYEADNGSQIVSSSSIGGDNTNGL